MTYKDFQETCHNDAGFAREHSVRRLLADVRIAIWHCRNTWPTCLTCPAMRYVLRRVSSLIRQMR